MKIYTRTGDKGETSLFGGKRVSKNSLRIEAIGAIDELNSIIGEVIAEIQNSRQRRGSPKAAKFKVPASRQGGQSYNAKLKGELEKIQNDLFEVGSMLASPGIRNQESGVRNLEKRVDQFEQLIDEMTKQLPELRNFILPGGGVAGARLHFARSIARRAERRIVALAKKEKITSEILIYFNRLSDLLFTMARFVNHKEKQKETIWNKT